MNNIRRLMVIGTLATGMLGLAGSPAFASPPTSYAPDGAGKTTYNTSTNHYTIYDTKGDRRAVAVKFYRPGHPSVLVGFQSCHEGNGDNCPGDLPSWVRGPLCMQTGVGLGSNPNSYRFGREVCVRNA